MKKFILLGLFILFLIQPAYAIKVGLVLDDDKVYLGTATEGQIVDTTTSKQIMPLCKLTTYEIKSKRNHFEIRSEDSDKVKIENDRITIRTFDSNSYICVKQKWYKGTIHIINNNGNMTVINDVGIEDYVRGVTPAEMPSSWNMEALKAQAIAVRSYAIANLGKHASQGFDLLDSTMDQVYNGVLAETSATNKAVDETKGLVLTYNNKIISTMYSASAGGQTKSALQAWGNDIPYLQSVKSFDDETGIRGHGVGMTQYGAKNLADMGYNAYQILAYFYTGAHFARINPDVYK